MISKKRSKIDIIVDALEVAHKNTTKTNLILRLNMGWRKGEEIIELLISKDLIRKVDAPYSYKTNIYVITQEGIIFLERYEKITDKLDYEIIDRYQTP